MASTEGVASRQAALRVLLEQAGLGGPPDVEFLEPPQKPGSGTYGGDAGRGGAGAAPFVALVRPERWLRGGLPWAAAADGIQVCDRRRTLARGCGVLQGSLRLHAPSRRSGVGRRTGL